MRKIPICKHLEREVHAKGLCASCYATQLRKKNPDYRQKHAMYQRGWHKRNPEKVREHRRKYLERHPEKVWQFSHAEDRKQSRAKWRLKNRYGLSLEEYAAMLLAQNNHCAICDANFSIEVPYVDHNHSTGKVRGILCATCNMGLGSYKDNVILLEKAISYLRRFSSESAVL